MRIRNEVAEAVAAEVEEYRHSGRREPLLCRCPLCLADVSALALTILPPRYSTAERAASTGGPGDLSSTARSAVFTSMRRVNRRPKHDRSRPENRPASVRLVNFAYEEGASLVASLVRRTEVHCTCRTCIGDTLAYALNRYPHKYGVLHKGRESLPSYQRAFMREELMIIISHAAGVVSSKPRHVPVGGG